MARHWRWIGFAPLVLAVWISAPVEAHGPMHEQIARATRHIEREPKDASLWLMRGSLHRIHADFEAAILDFDRAAELDADVEGLDRERGRALLDAGRPSEALPFLDRAIARQSGDVRARVARARALAALHRSLDAADELDRVLQRAKRPLPQYYLDRADALTRHEPSSDALVDRALRGLEEARPRLGFLIVLEERALEIERATGRHDAALARLASIETRYPRVPKWKHVRGDVLVEADRADEARSAYGEALSLIHALPASRRSTALITDTEREIRTALEALESSP